MGFLLLPLVDEEASAFLRTGPNTNRFVRITICSGAHSRREHFPTREGLIRISAATIWVRPN